MNMLNESKVATRLPAQDLERARRFYAEKLGLCSHLKNRIKFRRREL
jgi:extradiol dioxygenase family protein